MVEATINGVFVRDPAEPVELGETKQEAPTLDGYRFHQMRNISTDITMSRDPQDGGNYALLIGCFIDGLETGYTTGWIRNDDDLRHREYAFEVPKHPVKLMAAAPKVHTVQIKVGVRRTVFGIPLPALISRNYDLAESDIYYYKIGLLPE